MVQSNLLSATYGQTKACNWPYYWRHFSIVILNQVLVDLLYYIRSEENGIQAR
jgi:hypothetical protein